MFAASGGAVSDDKTYIEDVFSTYLYTGSGSTQTINNGIDLAGKGGMVWIKNRLYSSSDFRQHIIQDTVRGTQKYLLTNSSQAGGTLISYGGISSFNGNGYSVTDPVNEPYVSWTFRKAPKFFDVVTYTGTGIGNNSVSHSLGMIPGLIIAKAIGSTEGWYVVHHRNGGSSNAIGLNLNYTNGGDGYPAPMDLIHTDKTFRTDRFGYGTANTAGVQYVAYLFAHDTTTDGLIQCGSYTGNGSATGPSITLGWEPQWLMIKNASGTGNWQIIDNMRGMTVGSADATLQSNLSDTESSVEYISPTATGFQVTSTSTEVNTSGSTYIYMAIRRGPMRTPTDATKVFAPVLSNTGTNPRTITTNFPVDLTIATTRGYNIKVFVDRLRGGSTTKFAYLDSTSTAAEGTGTGSGIGIDNNTAIVDNDFINNATGIFWNFRRASGFFDVVCYTGTGNSNDRPAHSLAALPELIIYKQRSGTSTWYTVVKLSSNNWRSLQLNTTASDTSVRNYDGLYNSTTNFYPYENSADANIVAYLFASCPGVSKVGSYTGNALGDRVIDCGFTNGARFVMIKRTDADGDWYVWDTARGIVAAEDPRLSINSTAAEVTNNDAIDPDPSGFRIGIYGEGIANVLGATYIYLAIA